jgi:hypothetical protein
MIMPATRNGTFVIPSAAEVVMADPPIDLESSADRAPAALTEPWH